MGRELRRVPPGWEHPQITEPDPWRGGERTRYQPLFDEPYGPRIEEWIEQHRLWSLGQHPDQAKGYGDGCKHYAEYESAPEPRYYRPDWKPEEATWYQVYETVSEGTPVSPPFETREELVEYLVEHGDFWDQKRRAEGHSSLPCEPWSRKAAEAFVFGGGWAPSLVMSDGRVRSGVEALGEDPRP